MRTINSRLEQIEKQLCINEPPVVFEYTDANGIEHKIEMTWDEWVNFLKNIPPTKGILPREEDAAMSETLGTVKQ